MQGGVSVYCFRLVRRVMLSLQSPRLSQQTLRVDWRTCGQAWPPSLFCSHGTDSRPDIFPENMFFQLTFSGFNFWLNPLLWISTCFFLFSTLAGSVSWNRSDSARNARSLWYSLKSSLASYFFFVFMLVRPRLTDLWFFFCVLSYIFFLYMNQTRLSRTFVCVNASPRRHTEIRNKEHVSIWTLWCVLVFFFTTLGGSALGMTTLICQLVQTEISQQTQDRLPWNFFIDIHGAQRIIPADFSLSATMRLAFVVSSEVF